MSSTVDSTGGTSGVPPWAVPGTSRGPSDFVERPAGIDATMPFWTRVLATGPSGPSLLLKGNDVSGNLVDSLVGNDGVVSGAALTYGVASPWAGLEGLVRLAPTSRATLTHTADQNLGDGPSGVMFAVRRVSASLGDEIIVKGDKVTVPGYAFEIRNGTPDTIRVQQGSTATAANNTADLIDNLELHLIVCTHPLAGLWKIYIDGLLVAVSTSALTFSNSGANLVIGSDGGSTSFEFGAFAEWPAYEPTATDVAALWASRNTPLSTSAPVLVTPTTATLVTTGFAPVIGLGIIPTTAALTLTGFAPVIGLAVVPTTAALTLTGFAPVIGLAVIPSTAALVLTGYPPIMPVVPTTAALVLTGFAPVLDLGIIPTTAALTLTTFAPVIGFGVVPSTATLALTGLAPTVSTTNNQLVTPAAAALTLTGFAPVIDLGIVPGVAGLTLTGFAPVIRLGVVPDVGGLVLTGFAPVVSATANQLVIPGTAALAIAGFAPGIALGIVPTTAALVVASFAPTVTATLGVTASPDPAVLVLTSFAPVVTGSFSSVPVVVVDGPYAGGPEGSPFGGVETSTPATETCPIHPPGVCRRVRDRNDQFYCVALNPVAGALMENLKDEYGVVEANKTYLAMRHNAQGPFGPGNKYDVAKKRRRSSARAANGGRRFKSERRR